MVKALTYVDFLALTLLYSTVICQGSTSTTITISPDSQPTCADLKASLGGGISCGECTKVKFSNIISGTKYSITCLGCSSGTLDSTPLDYDATKALDISNKCIPDPSSSTSSSSSSTTGAVKDAASLLGTLFLVLIIYLVAMPILWLLLCCFTCWLCCSRKKAEENLNARIDEIQSRMYNRKADLDTSSYPLQPKPAMSPAQVMPVGAVAGVGAVASQQARVPQAPAPRPMQMVQEIARKPETQIMQTPQVQAQAAPQQRKWNSKRHDFA